MTGQKTQERPTTSCDVDCYPAPNDIEFSGEEEGAQRLTTSPLQ
jgi:hypothetical protein